ncbi:rRNA maturation RNase YbeY [Thermodesulfobacteriota bacterium]
MTNQKIKAMVKTVLSALDCSSDVELSVLFVDDDEIRALNKEYLNRDYPTDVISFSMREGEFSTLNENLLGDVVVSLDNAKEYAEKKGVTLENEVMFLLIHGILHLVGYDHEREGSDALSMKKKEEELYSLLTE